MTKPIGCYGQGRLVSVTYLFSLRSTWIDVTFYVTLSLKLVFIYVISTTDSAGKEQQQEQDPMLWWRQNANRYPMLRSLARRYLGPPPSSVASERLFSSAGDICTDSRSRLLADNAEMLIVLKVNMLLCNSK